MKRLCWQLLLICSLVILAYGNIFYNGFAIDDHVFIGSYHPTIREAFAGVVPAGHEDVYRPIRGLLYTLYFHAFGTNQFFYHLHSLAVHLASTVLVFFILRHLSTLSHLRDLGFPGALLFGLHPIHTETITYIASSMDATGLLLFLLSWLLYLQKKYPWALLVGIISFFTTEMALTLPLFLLLQELIFNEAVTKPCPRGPLGHVAGTLRNAMKKIWPLFVAAGGYLAVRFFVLGIGARGVYLADSFYLTMLTMSKVLLQYLTLLLWPQNLMHNHIISPGIEAFVYRGYRTEAIASQTLFDPEILLSIGVIVVIGVIGWKMRNKYPVISFGIGTFFLGLLPVMEFVPQGSMMNERSLYLSSVGFFLVLGYGLSKFIVLPKTKIVALAGCMLLLLFYTGRTMLRNRDWRDDVALFTKDVNAAPNDNAYAYFALGNAYNEKKDYQKAIEQYQKSVAINTRFAVGYASLARTYRDMGNTELSNINYQLAEQKEPGFWSRP